MAAKRDDDDALLDSLDAGSSKRARVDAPEGDPSNDDLDALLGSVDGIFDNLDEPSEPPEEAARRGFAERLQKARSITGEELPELLAVLRDEAPKWGTTRQSHSAALLLVYVSRSSRNCRAAFVATGLPVLSSVLQDGVAALETGDAAQRSDAGMRCMACLVCLRALPIGRSTMWTHRRDLGQPFDRLHKWCGKEKSALAAELRAPTLLLCKRWKQQPKPAMQESTPEQKALRLKVVDMISQGLLGIAGHNSPASPAGIAASPGRLPPSLTAGEVEAALYGRFGGATHEYKQHARMLRANLAAAGNGDLRDRVLSGDLPAEQLAAMESDALAPAALQEARKKVHQEAMKEVVYTATVPLQRLHSESDGRYAYNAGTAPPAFVTLDQLQEESKSEDAGSKDDLEASAAPTSMDPPATPFMAPPPTPFRVTGDAVAVAPGELDASSHHTPEVLPTPAPDEDDDEAAALVRFFSQAV